MQEKLAKRSEKDEMERTKLLADSASEGRLGSTGPVVPKLQVAPNGLGLPPKVPNNTNRMDEDKDAEIQRLRQEIESMKRTMTSMYQQNSGRLSRGGSSRGGNNSRGGVKSRGRSSSRGSLKQAGSRISSSGRNNEVEINSESSQRLVLKSRDGRPRVPLTPSQMKMEQKKQERRSARRQEDINAVKDLY